MRAGETDRAISIVDARLEEVGFRLSRVFEHPGVADCDVFLTPSGPVVLEVNPRFGGGYPFSQLAGADVPGALVDWFLDGTTRRPLSLRPGVIAAKCDGVLEIKNGR